MKIIKIGLITAFLLGINAQSWGQDVSQEISELGSEDLKKQQKARNELLAVMAEATSPGADSDSLVPIEKQVIAGLGSELPLESKLYLIRMLEFFGTSQSVSALADLLDDGEKEIRDSARRALAILPGDEAVTHLVKGLAKASGEEQAAYIGLLAYRKDPAIVSKLITQLESKETKTVLTAALALGELGDKKAIPALLAAHRKATNETRLSFETALLGLELDTEQTEDLFESGSNVGIRVAAFKKLIGMANTANGQDSSIFATFKKLIGRADTVNGQEYLNKVMTDGGESHRASFIFAAISEGPKELTDSLVAGLGKNDLEDQLVIVSTIGQLDRTGYETELLALLKASEGELRTALFNTLSRVGGDASFDQIYQAFLSDSKSSDLAHAISVVRAPSADSRILETATNGTDVQARIAALKVLELRNTPGATELMNQLASGQGDPKLRAAAFKSLETIGDFETVKIMLDLITKQDSQMSAAQRSLKRLAGNFGNPQEIWDKAFGPTVKKTKDDQIASELVKIMDVVIVAESMDYLKEVLLDRDSGVRPEAIKVLDRFPPLKAGQVWLDLVSDERVNDEDLTVAEKALIKILSKEGRRLPGKQVDLAVSLVQNTTSKKFKQSMIEFYKNPPKNHKRYMKKAFNKLKNDPDVGDEVTEILNQL